MSNENEDNVLENPTEIIVEPEIEVVDEGSEDSFEPDRGSREPEDAKPVVDEDEERQKKHISLKTQFNKVQREKYRAQHEADVLRKELEKYRSLAEKSNEAASVHYDNTIELQLTQAKAEKKAARENGDYEAEAIADEKLAMAIAKKTQSEAFKSQQKYLKEQQAQQPQESEYQQPEYDYQEVNDDAKDWLNRNPWFVSNSEDDQALAQEVQSFSEVLERKYRRQGMDEQLFTKAYFDEIDSYIKEQILEEPPVEKQVPTNPARSNLNMKPVRQAAPVGRTPKNPDSPARRTVSLSPQEKEMAKIMNLTDQDYAKWKIKDQEKQSAKGRPY